MKKNTVVKVVLLVIIGLIMLSINIDVKADDNLILVSPNNTSASATNNATNGLVSLTNNTVQNPVVSPSPAATTPLTQATPVVNTINKVNTTNVNKANNLPSTGPEDYTVVFVIMGICMIFALYAYKNASDYNEIK